MLGVVIQTSKVSDTGESLNLGINISLMMGFIVFFYSLQIFICTHTHICLLYTSPSPRDAHESGIPA